MVCLHGVTATRRYVLHGSRSLERAGFHVVSYDARGHGESDAAPDPSAYEYRDLVADLAAVLDGLELERAVLAGNSMGAHTAIAFALACPDRVAALVQITPSYAGRPPGADDERAPWDALADALESDGVDGFLRAYDPGVEGGWRDTIMEFTRQRLERHRDLRAVAAAIRVVPRSVAFEGMEELEAVRAPTMVVGSRDEADPGHPLEVAEAYAERLPDAELVVEDEGSSPLAWQGARLGKAIAGFLRRVAPDSR